jgi:hypothetical protein
MPVRALQAAQELDGDAGPGITSGGKRSALTGTDFSRAVIGPKQIRALQAAEKSHALKGHGFSFSRAVSS